MAAHSKEGRIAHILGMFRAGNGHDATAGHTTGGPAQQAQKQANKSPGNLNGTNGDDLLDFGTESNDLKINGNSGDDTIIGGSGDDQFNGNAGDDSISGGGGDDKINGNAGDDTIDGGDGDDTLKGNEGDDELSGGAGNDDIKGGEGDDTVDGGEGNDSLGGGDGFDTAAFDGSILDFMIQGVGSGNQVTVSDTIPGDGDEGTDTLTGFEALQFDDYTLLMDGSNNAPLVVAPDQSTDEDTATVFSVSAYDFDGDAIVIDSVAYVGAGSLTLLSTTPLSPLLGSGVQLNFAFDPNGAYESLGVGDTVVETVTVTVSDGNGGTQVSTFDITINGVNDPPVAVDDSATTPEDTAIDITVLDNDSDPEGDILTVTAAVAANGSVVINANGTLTYTPNANFNGTDTIIYTVDDGNGGTDSGDVVVTVTPVNDAPEAAAPNAPAEIVNEADGIANIDLIGRTSDVDGDTVSVLFARFIDPITEVPVGPLIQISNGVAVFDPAEFGLSAGQSQEVRIQYLIRDDSGAANDSAIGFVDVTINGSDDVVPPANQAPVAGVLDLSGDPAFDEATGDISIDIGSVVSDADGDFLTVVAVFNGDGQEFTFSQTGTVLTFDPQQFGLDVGESGLIELGFIVDDGSGAANSQATGGILFNLDGAEDVVEPPTNTAPTANAVVLSANEVDGEIVIDLNGEVSDADGDQLTIAAVRYLGGSIPFSVEGGLLIIDPAVFGLNDGETDTFEFEYDVQDDSGQANSITTGTISITVNGFTEDAPPEPETSVILDFEVFESATSDTIVLTGGAYEGFSFSGNAVVIETDEIGGGGRDPNGILTGQTTPGGDNVLVGSLSTIEVPVLDGEGNPVLDPETGLPVTETVVDAPFGIFGPGSTFDFDDQGVFLSSGLAGEVPPLPAELPEAVGDSFSLDGMSLNIPSGATTVMITTYTIGVIEVPNEFNPAISSFYLQYVAVDTFEFALDGSTPATVLDFNDPAFMDALGNTNTAGFDDIYAISFETLDGTPLVLDDILITL